MCVAETATVTLNNDVSDDTLFVNVSFEKVSFFFFACGAACPPFHPLQCPPNMHLLACSILLKSLFCGHFMAGK